MTDTHTHSLRTQNDMWVNELQLAEFQDDFCINLFIHSLPNMATTGEQQLCLYIELASWHLHTTINKRINKAIIVHNNPYQKGGTHWRFPAFLPALLLMTKRQYAKRDREKERGRDRETEKERSKEEREDVWISIGIAIKKEMLEIPMRSPTRIDFVLVATTAIALPPPPLATCHLSSA